MQQKLLSLPRYFRLIPSVLDKVDPFLPDPVFLGNIQIIPKLVTLDGLLLEIKDGGKILAKGVYLTPSKPAEISLPLDSSPYTKIMELSLISNDGVSYTLHAKLK